MTLAVAESFLMPQKTHCNSLVLKNNWKLFKYYISDVMAVKLLSFTAKKTSHATPKIHLGAEAVVTKLNDDVPF